MKKRLKMILTASMLAFCLALMGFGVYAASSHTLGVQNTISFDIGDNIAFTIKAERTAPSGNLGSRTTAKEYYNQTSAQGGAAYEVGMADNDGKLAAWTMSDPILLYAGETITWGFTIVNLSENSFYINMIDAVNPWGTNASFTSESNKQVPASQTPVVYTIKYTVIESPTFVENLESQALSFGLKLNKEQMVKTPTYDKLKFTLIEDNENGNYYEVSAKDYNITGEVVIPNTYKPSDSGSQTYGMSTYAIEEELPVRAIAEGGFCNIENYVGVKITSIDFSNCYNLSIIGPGAFSGCENLTSIDFPESLTTIGLGAFSGCENLTSIDFPESLTTIGMYAFSVCQNLTSIDLSNCPNLTTIDEGAFNWSFNITNINLSNCSNLTTIGMYAFSECNLTNINLSNCTNLTTIEGAFASCYKLVQIKYNSNAPIFSTTPTYSTFGLEELNPDMEIVDEKTSFTNTLEEVGDYTYYTVGTKKYLMGFSEQGINNTEVKNTASDITDIYQYAFHDVDLNVLVTSVDLSGCTNLTTIGRYAFYSCDSLTSVDLSNCSNLTIIGSAAFSYCENLTCIDLSNCTQLTTIREYAFEYCRKLTSADLSSCANLTTIGDYAFQLCYHIASVDLLGCSKLTTIGDEAFSDSRKLVQIKYNSNAPIFSTTPTYSTFGLKKANPDMEIVDEKTSFTNTLEEVGDYTYYTVGTKKYLIGFSEQGINNIEVKNTASDITDIYQYAFYNNNYLISIDLTNCSKLTTIGEETFSRCYDLAIVDLSDCSKLITIDNKAFYTCEKLIRVDLPESLMEIGEDAFTTCYYLTKIDFSNCSKLTTIGNYAFNGCYKLVQIKYNSNAPIFSTTPTYSTFGLKKANPDMEIVDEKTSFTNTLEEVGDYTYYTVGTKKYLIGFSEQGIKNTKIKSVASVASDITDIYQYAFYMNYDMTNIDFLSNCSRLTTICEWAFGYCQNLTSIDLSNCTNLTMICTRVFAGCWDLNVYLPKSLEGSSNLTLENGWGPNSGNVIYK